MKLPSRLSLASLCGALLCLAPIGCVRTVAVVPEPGPTYVWAGPGYYGGTYYASRATYYNSAYYRSYQTSAGGRGAAYRGPYNNAGYVDTARGGSANWHNGSGSAEGARGGSANWDNGSGSAEGWRGGSASWGGGTRSVEGPNGRSASRSRR